MEGTHDLNRSFAVTQRGLNLLFTQLYTQRVLLEGMLLKPNMVLARKDSPEQNTIEQVADATVTCLLRSVPPAVAGIAFLSEGQSPEQATSHLNAMHRSGRSAGAAPGQFAGKLPWPLTFSFARAIQQPALDLWKGQESNVEAAQHALFYRASCSRDARQGKYQVENT